MSMIQIFLLVNMFALGIAITIAIQHAYSHYMHKKHPEREHAALKDTPLPQQLKEQLIQQAQENFQTALSTSTDSLRHDLKATSDRINLHLEELGNDILHQEVERYRAQLDALYGYAENDVNNEASEVKNLVTEHKQKLNALGEQASTTITGANQDIESYKQELKGKLDQLYQQADAAIVDVSGEIQRYTQELKQQLSQETAAEKQQLIEQFELRLSDAVVSFLMETLGHNVDLGAQSDYLTAVLEEHKDELLEGVRDESQAA